MSAAISLREIATPENFNETAYLASNPDVKEAVTSGTFTSGKAHFDAFGRKEGRTQLSLTSVAAVRAEKMLKLAKSLLLDRDTAVDEHGRFNFLTEAIRAETRIIDTNNVSSNAYDRLICAHVQLLNI